ncbi:hypothetical protein [Priestia megaterium]|uniref:hypothetical protein n=1 Tax=Priestia megaterium TaxID=1404 RepID=UPI003CC6C7DA
MNKHLQLIELLKELCIEQHKTLVFVNKINFSVTKEQLELDYDKRNESLLDLSWGTNDCITDNPRQHEIMGILERDYGIVIHSKEV